MIDICYGCGIDEEDDDVIDGGFILLIIVEVNQWIPEVVIL